MFFVSTRRLPERWFDFALDLEDESARRIRGVDRLPVADLLRVSEEEEEDDGNLIEVDDNLAGVLVEHEVREALLPRLVDREALAPPLLFVGSQIFALLISGEDEKAAERLRVVVEASLRWFRLDVLGVIRLLCVLVEIVLLLAPSGLLIEACNSSESESDKSQFDLHCCACLRCFGDDGMFSRILLGMVREWLLLVAVVAVDVVAVVVLLLLCKLHDMTSEDPVVIFTWCAPGMITCLVESFMRLWYVQERGRHFRGFVNGASLFHAELAGHGCSSVVVW